MEVSHELEVVLGIVRAMADDGQVNHCDDSLCVPFKEVSRSPRSTANISADIDILNMEFMARVGARLQVNYQSMTLHLGDR